MVTKNIFARVVGLAAALSMIASFSFVGAAEPSKLPNILLIYLDDLGYGDLGCTNSESKIPTPNIDKLAAAGMLFTDAHAAASVCGPSRYGLLTGRYPWRRGKGGTGNGAKFRDVFIEEGRMTLASLLKQKGYNTAQIGKWGLRHNYSEAVLPGKEPGTLDAYDFGSKKLMGSQLFGFDYAWTITYLDQRNSNIKTPFENSKPLDSKLAPTDPHSWLPDSANKVMDYLKFYAGKAEIPPYRLKPQSPFFLYWDPTGPHTPYVPNEPFIGKTDVGPYGDFVYEIDHYVGRMVEMLEKLRLAENTLIIFASDNGPDKYAYEHLERFGHYSMGTRRGIKTDAFEGGHRSPLIVRWPGVVEEGVQSDALVSLTDWFATLAEMSGQSVEDGAGEDSLSLLSLLKGERKTPYRESAVHHSTKGVFAIRQGDWVFVDSKEFPTGEPEWFRKLRGFEASSAPGQLYNLQEDPSQSLNLYDRYPEKAKALKQLLVEAREEG